MLKLRITPIFPLYMQYVPIPHKVVAVPEKEK
jgi:hypothetical protein